MTNDKLSLLSALYASATTNKTQNAKLSKTAGEAADLNRPNSLKPQRHSLNALAKKMDESSNEAGEAALKIKNLINDLSNSPQHTHSSVRSLSIVTTKLADGSTKTVFISPFLGGTKLPNDITAITPETPIALALLGKTKNDTFAIGKTTGQILQVA